MDSRQPATGHPGLKSKLRILGLILYRVAQIRIVILYIVDPLVGAPRSHQVRVKRPQQIDRWSLRIARFKPSLRVPLRNDHRHAVVTGRLGDQLIGLNRDNGECIHILLLSGERQRRQTPPSAKGESSFMANTKDTRRLPSLRHSMNVSMGTRQRLLRNESCHMWLLSSASPFALIVLSLNFFGSVTNRGRNRQNII